jgi:hypothetical protein
MRRLADAERLRRFLKELYRYPAVDPASFRRAVLDVLTKRRRAAE